MVRSAITNAGDALTDEDEAQPDPSRARTAQPPSLRWRGSGGRWLIWVGRAVVWAVLLLIGYRGVFAIVTGTRPARAAPSTAARVNATTAPGVPPSLSSLAGAFALDFGRVYLDYGPGTAAARSRELAQFVPPGADSQFGWNGVGADHVLAEQVASIAVTDRHSVVVTLLATVSTGRLIELAVPVYMDHGSLVVPNRPALLAPPARAVPHLGGQTAADPAAEAALQSQLPAFFAAYASGDQATLSRFTAPGSHLRGLDGLVAFGGLDSVFAPPGGDRRTITASVTWKLTSAAQKSRPRASATASLQMTYRLTVVRQGASWDVLSIGAGASAQEPP
jgi:hypothetical protein